MSDRKRSSQRPTKRRANLVIFRLAFCRGLRVIGLEQLRMGDVRVDQAHSHLRTHRGTAEGGNAWAVFAGREYAV